MADLLERLEAVLPECCSPFTQRASGYLPQSRRRPEEQ
jgi:hypothetical protein